MFKNLLRVFWGLSMLLSSQVLAQGEGAPVKTIFIKVDPQGTYLFVDSSAQPPDLPDAARSPTRFSLLALYQDPEVMLQAGDLIGFELIGAFQNADPMYGGYDGIQTLLGLFNSPLGYLFPGPMGSASGVVSSPTYFRNIPTDIPEDFNILPGTIVYAQVPKYATEILFSPNDSFFADNSDPNNDYGVYLKISVLKQPKYALEKILYENGKIVNSNFHKMTPSRLACGLAPTVFSTRQMKFTCLQVVEYEDGPPEYVATAGCKLRLGIEDGGYDGAHNRETHTDSPIRWGRVRGYDLGTEISVPMDGLTLTYDAPEVAGELKMTFEAKDPEGNDILSVSRTLFEIRHDQNLTELYIPGLTLDISSHPGDGYFVTETVKSSLKSVIESFRKNFAEKYPDLPVPNLETEGASLSWGGLFDVNKNWSAPHCGHRKGTEVDLSMSVFDRFGSEIKKKMKQDLAKELRRRKFQMPYEGERPGEAYSNHWHIIGK